jgi:hypothetical protein
MERDKRSMSASTRGWAANPRHSTLCWASHWYAPLYVSPQTLGRLRALVARS